MKINLFSKQLKGVDYEIHQRVTRDYTESVRLEQGKGFLFNGYACGVIYDTHGQFNEIGMRL